MLNISKEQLEENLDYPILIETLRKAFQEKYIVPIRHHHNYQNPKEGVESTLLLMPAWQVGKYLGVKMVTVSPKNGKYNLPSIHGIYTLFDAAQGMPLAQINATTLTAQRTAAASALASSFLSKKNSKTLLMVGTGALAPELIRAHISVRPIETVYVWGRNLEKAKAVSNFITKYLQVSEKANFEVFPIENIEEGIEKADIISCATLSPTPLIFGKNLKAGQHLDLVGAYRPDMREADDEVILKSSVFIDTYDGMHESGDIASPLKDGILKRENICGDLFQLCRGEKTGRKNNNEITFFKSVGHALEDLAAAKLIYEKLN
jgi:ornithine cyclodeaminase/alanine dehydrogenase-like protein (mu-crystallin family)